MKLKINYLQPVNLGDFLIGNGKIDFHEKSIVVSSRNIYKKHINAIKAIAIGTFNIYNISKRQ